jgi:hypothetical protein
MRSTALIGALLLAACVPPGTNYYPDYSGGTAVAPTQPFAPPAKLLIFGGEDHKTYLGCLNCGEYSSDSILNQFGSYGSQFSPTSITNQFNPFGSLFSGYSACNQYASDPPVVVDEAGHFYGRLTVNQFNPQRLPDPTVAGWLAAKCAH